MCVHTLTYIETCTQIFTLAYSTKTHFFGKRTKVNLKGVENRIVVVSLGRALGQTGECLWPRGRVVRTQGCLSFDENVNV